MVTNLPLVDAPNLSLILGPTVAVAAALGAWVSRLEAAFVAARHLAPVDGEAEVIGELPSAAAA